MIDATLDRARGLLARKLGRGARPLRIAYGRIFHEANAYSPLTTSREDFERMHALEGERLARATTLRGSEFEGYMPHAELSGFVQAARLAGGVEAVPLASYMAVPSGPVSEACFAWLLDGLLSRLEAALREGPLDGVYLALHGSMEVVGLDEAPEAVILRRVRAMVGREARIAVSYDLHANLSSGLVDPVDVLVAYRTNPHWDLAPTGFRAGQRLIRALRGSIARPVHAWRKLPITLGGGATIDFLAPMRGVFKFMRDLEKDPRVVSASLFMVHPFTSAEDLGWAVHVSTDGDEALAGELADRLADRAWAERTVELPPRRTPLQGLGDAAKTWARRLGPVTFVDMDDIVGAGAPGGNTRILEALAHANGALAGRTALVPIHDPRAVAALAGARVGDRVRVDVRGTEGYDQPTVPLDGIVEATRDGDFGRVVRLDVATGDGTLVVALSDRPPLPIHPKFWRELGVDPRKADVMVQKNFFHYRIFYALTSFAHVPVITEGATSFERVVSRPYAVPTHPKHALDGWRDADPVLRSAPRRSGAADVSGKRSSPASPR
ncbi:MAG: M81 family metallopeptidase [Polyangiaceae bacterium]